MFINIFPSVFQFCVLFRFTNLQYLIHYVTHSKHYYTHTDRLLYTVSLRNFAVHQCISLENQLC